MSPRYKSIDIRYKIYININIYICIYALTKEGKYVNKI